MSETKNKILGFFDENRFLSNFYPCKITINGHDFSSVECAYQAQKFPLSDWYKISKMSPGQAKQYGRSYIFSLSVSFKLDIMYLLLKMKFSSPNNELLQKLLDTGDSELIELNTWGDRFWGMELVDGELVGKNHLGKLLMRVRMEHSLYEY